MAAFYGGDCGMANRHSQPEVTYLDITGHYPVSAHLAGTFDLLRATKLEIKSEDPDELQQLIATTTPETLLQDQHLWRRLATTVCVVEPNGQTLPHRVRTPRGLQTKVAPIHSAEPLVYLLADLVLNGNSARIVTAFSVRTLPRRRKRLRHVALRSGHLFNPGCEDLFVVLAEERLRLQQHPALPPAERERQAKLLKLIVNAACYGLLCQFNVTNNGGRTDLVELDGTTRTVTVDRVEEPGRWAHPIAASGVTATGSLLLRLARKLVEHAGGRVLLWDTDSLAVHGLTDAQLADVQRELERISPYNPIFRTQPHQPLLLALEPENFHPESGERIQLRLNATASKNYDLYTIEPDGRVELRKWSEHGLGHLPTPGHPEVDDRTWIAQGRRHLLEKQLGIRSSRPSFWRDPQFSILTLNRPRELGRLQAVHPDAVLLPFSRIVVAHPVSHYAGTPEGKRLTPIAPYHDGFSLQRVRWSDLASGTPLAIHYPSRTELCQADLRADDHSVLGETIGTALQRNSTRPESKALDETGRRCTRNTIGPLSPAPTRGIRIEAIGKETRNLERAGITETPPTRSTTTLKATHGRKRSSCAAQDRTPHDPSRSAQPRSSTPSFNPCWRTRRRCAQQRPLHTDSLLR
jgi:hypothetical protein